MGLEPITPRSTGGGSNHLATATTFFRMSYADLSASRICKTYSTHQQLRDSHHKGIRHSNYNNSRNLLTEKFEISPG